MTQQIKVDANALREVLVALNGGAHQIRELQVLSISSLFPENPISILTKQFNDFVEGKPE